MAGVYIDPWKKVDRALITHGHSDHARTGHQAYLCSTAAAPAIRHRLGPINLETIQFGKVVRINGVTFSFHPAGHILGSAQIRVEYKGEIWVVSGDYKLENDGVAEAFEPVECHSFITESTFGLPIYDWRPQSQIFAEINLWWKENTTKGLTSILTGYSLGKAQRIICGLDQNLGSIYTHPAVEKINEVFRNQDVVLSETIMLTENMNRKDLMGNIIIVPPSAANGQWVKKVGPYAIANASGWMTLRGARRRQGIDRGFVLSDHVDWKGLNRAVKETKAEKVFVTHGYSDTYARYLNEQGVKAHVVSTEYTGEALDPIQSAGS